jgi:hypothetical protein
LSEQRKYRQFTPEQKAEIVLAGLRGDRSVRDVCREGTVALRPTASSKLCGVEVHPYFEALRTAPTRRTGAQARPLSAQVEGIRSVDGSMQQRQPYSHDSSPWLWIPPGPNH